MDLADERTPTDADALFGYARAEPRAWPEQAPARRRLSPDAWATWSPDDAPPSAVHADLLAGHAGRWEELRRVLADDADRRWCRLVWRWLGDAQGARLRALLDELPRPRLREVLAGIGPSARAPREVRDLFLDADLAGDEAFAMYVALRPLEEVPWSRVEALASRAEWSAARATCEALLDRRANADSDTAGAPTDSSVDPPGGGRPLAELLALVCSSAAYVEEREETARALLRRAGADTLPVFDSLAEGDALRACVAPLLRLREPGELARALASHGLVDPAADAALRLPDDLLQRWGRMVVFETKTGRYPNDYPSVLGRLADLAPGLEDVVFEEIPPADGDSPSPRRSEQLTDAYRLRAWRDDVCLEVVTGDHASHYDVAAILDFFNAVCRWRGLSDRAVAIRVGYAVGVVLGPGAGLLDAVRAGLIPGLEVDVSFEEAQRRFPRRELTVDIDPRSGRRTLVWWRAVVERVTDPESEVALAELPGDDDLRVGDVCGTIVR